MASEDNILPSQAFFGRRQRQILPLRTTDLTLAAIDILQKDKLACEQVERRNLHTKPFSPLAVGQECWLQHPASGEWYTTATILERRASDFYYIRTKEGAEYVRGRRLLRPVAVTAQVKRLTVIMPRQVGHKSYRDNSSAQRHHHDINNWSRLPPPPPLSLNLRDIRNVVVHDVNGSMPDNSFQERRYGTPCRSTGRSAIPRLSTIREGSISCPSPGPGLSFRQS